MRHLKAIVFLGLAIQFSPATAQIALPQSSSPTSVYAGPCPKHCVNPDARRLQFAIDSPDTRPHQKAKIFEIMKLYRKADGINWKGAADAYFYWRNNDEARYLSAAAPQTRTAAPPSNATSAPRLLNGNSLIMPSDYPAGSMARGEEGISAFELTLKNGRPASCKITSSSGFGELDEAACRLATERSIFDMSALPKGALSTYSNRVSWSIPAWDQPRPFQHNLTATQSVSRIDPNKIRCHYSDGYIGFVIAGSPCVKGAPAQNSKTSYARVAPTIENAITKSDFERSLKAARSGDTAQFLPVASMYMAGTGVGKDDVKALFWIRAAEKAGLAEAKYTLALLHADGGAVERDFQKSYDYLTAYVTAGYASQKTIDLSERIKRNVGEHGFSCMTYGFRQETPSYSQCLMQTAQAEQLAQQQAQLARQQAQFAKQQAQFAEQQYRLQLEQNQRQLAAEQEARERAEEAERKAASERLFAMSADMLCPKKTRGGIFAEPVAGCGRNKNEREERPLTQIQICRAANPRNPEACH